MDLSWSDFSEESRIRRVESFPTPALDRVTDVVNARQKLGADNVGGGKLAILIACHSHPVAHSRFDARTNPLSW